MIEKCRYCDRPATHLCDFVTSFSPHETCDHPLCDSHRKPIVVQFWDAGSKGWSDTVDLCPGHALTDGFKPPFQPIRPRGRGRAA